jgi:GT2 family glycosyltransferase
MDEYEIILVDNASTDETAGHIRKNYPHIRLIVNNTNRGFASAVNQGIDASSSEYILLINADCEVYENSFDRLLEYLGENPEAAIAGPRILNSDGTIQYSCRTFPSFLDAAVHTLLTHIYPNNPVTRKYKLMDANRDQPFKVDWVSGSCMMIRARALEDTGTFDEKYFMYVEDIDLCYRMWQKGWEVHYMPYAEVLHHIAGSSRKKRSREEKSRRAQIKASLRMQKSVFYFFWKNYRGTSRVFLMPFILMALGSRFLAAVMKSLIRA